MINMEIKLSLLSESNKQKLANSLNEINDLNYSFDEWLILINSIKEMTDFFFELNSQEKVVNN